MGRIRTGLSQSVMLGSEPQDSQISDMEAEEEDMELARAAYEEMILNRQRAGINIEPEEMKTAHSSNKKAGCYAVDLDGVLHDLAELEHVNHVPHPRSHIDW
jgi:hypothetical protein